MHGPRESSGACLGARSQRARLVGSTQKRNAARVGNSTLSHASSPTTFSQACYALNTQARTFSGTTPSSSFLSFQVRLAPPRLRGAKTRARRIDVLGGNRPFSNNNPSLRCCAKRPVPARDEMRSAGSRLESVTRSAPLWTRSPSTSRGASPRTRRKHPRCSFPAPRGVARHAVASASSSGASW